VMRFARCGIALPTPAYLTGRFWTERELGALLHKSTLLPVLHNVTFEQVAEDSGILPDLGGFAPSRDSVDVIAEKIAAAILLDSVEDGRTPESPAWPSALFTALLLKALDSHYLRHW
jgi:hypothetical protein